MAKHTGRGIAAIEYPTGMNQNGDPSQCWIKVKPDGVSSLRRHRRHRQRTEDDPDPDRRRDHRRALRLGHLDNSNTDSSPMCTGTFASPASSSRATPRSRRRDRSSRSLSRLRQGDGDRRGRPRDRERRGDRQGRAAEEAIGGGRRWRGHVRLRRADHRYGPQLKPYAEIVDPETGQVENSPHSAISYAPAPPRSRWTTRRARARAQALRSVTTSAARSTRRRSRARSRAAPSSASDLECRDLFLVLPRGRAPWRILRVVPRAFDGRDAEIDTILIENPSADGPYGAKGTGEMANNPQTPAITSAVTMPWVCRLPSCRHARARPACARGEGRARQSRGAMARRSCSTRTLGEHGLERRHPLRGTRRRSLTPSALNGFDRWEIFPGVSVHAVGGEQVLLCHVRYEPGTRVARRHTRPPSRHVDR